MFIAFLITTFVGILLIFGAILINKNGSYSDAPMILSVIGGLLLLVAFILFMVSMRWQVSSSQLTGYIYQRQDSWGYSHYDLRYSQNAGVDSQPTFCVETDSDEDKKFQELVGDDTKKVTVTVPSAGFKLINNPYECSSFATLEKVVTVESAKE